jgi:hypothetical protein
LTAGIFTQVITIITKNKKSWNSVSLNFKQFVKRKDLNIVYPTKDSKKKSYETKLNTFKPTNGSASVEQQYLSALKNDKPYLVNSYFPSNMEFSKSFGSSIYNPISSGSSKSGNKLASLKNSLIMNSISNKLTGSTTTSYQSAKGMKKIDKKSIKFASKNQNLSFNDRSNTAIKNKIDPSSIIVGKKKRSASPVTKNPTSAYNSRIEDQAVVTKPKSRSGSRKNNTKSPNNARFY